MAAEHIGNAIGYSIGKFVLTVSRQTARAKWIRRRPCAGGVDHRAGEIAALTCGRLHRQNEGAFLASKADDLVQAKARNRRDARTRLHDVG